MNITPRFFILRTNIDINRFGVPCCFHTPHQPGVVFLLVSIDRRLLYIITRYSNCLAFGFRYMIYSLSNIRKY
jgi:hypothetical protein